MSLVIENLYKEVKKFSKENIAELCCNYDSFYCFIYKYWNLKRQHQVDDYSEIDLNQEEQFYPERYRWFFFNYENLLKTKEIIDNELLVEVPLIHFYEFAINNFEWSNEIIPKQFSIKGNKSIPQPPIKKCFEERNLHEKIKTFSQENISDFCDFKEFYGFIHKFLKMENQSEMKKFTKKCSIDLNNEKYFNTPEYKWFYHNYYNLLKVKQMIDKFLPFPLEIPFILFYEFAVDNFDVTIVYNSDYSTTTSTTKRVLTSISELPESELEPEESFEDKRIFSGVRN